MAEGWDGVDAASMLAEIVKGRAKSASRFRDRPDFSAKWDGLSRQVAETRASMKSRELEIPT